MSEIHRALIVVDVQNDYFTGNLPIEFPNADSSLLKINTLIDFAKVVKIPVVFVQNSLAANAPIFAHGSVGAEMHATINARVPDHAVSKNLPSAFVGTDLEEWLRQHDVDTVTVIGYMTHNCNLSTMLHAFHSGFAVEFIHDASGSVSYKNRAGSVTAEEIHRVISVVLQSRFAAVMSAGEWMALIESGQAAERDSIYRSNQRARGILHDA